MPGEWIRIAASLNNLACVLDPSHTGGAPLRARAMVPAGADSAAAKQYRLLRAFAQTFPADCCRSGSAAGAPARTFSTRYRKPRAWRKQRAPTIRRSELLPRTPLVYRSGLISRHLSSWGRLRGAKVTAETRSAISARGPFASSASHGPRQVAHYSPSLPLGGPRPIVRPESAPFGALLSTAPDSVNATYNCKFSRYRLCRPGSNRGGLRQLLRCQCARTGMAGRAAGRAEYGNGLHRRPGRNALRGGRGELVPALA